MREALWEKEITALTTETTADYTQASQNTALNFTDTWGETNKSWYDPEHHLFTLLSHDAPILKMFKFHWIFDISVTPGKPGDEPYQVKNK